MNKKSKILITGGTGSFGNALVKKIINYVSEIRIFSRDEKKQYDMRNEYKNNKIKFYIGDVRDRNALQNAIIGVDYIFHAAALKQVPTCEFYPSEAVKTNIHGIENVIEVGKKNLVKKIICLSTDKAVYPINAMGISKAMMEKIAISKARMLEESITKVCITRYGNVMNSRGSVIPLFIDQIKKNKKLTVTDPNMTRFLMNLDEAIELVLFAIFKGKNGQIIVQKSPAATILDLAKAILIFHDKPRNFFEIIGTRHGEKKHETLLSEEEYLKCKTYKNYFIVDPDFRDLNYDLYFKKGIKKLTTLTPYTSENTKRLSVNHIKKLLKNI